MYLVSLVVSSMMLIFCIFYFILIYYTILVYKIFKKQVIDEGFVNDGVGMIDSESLVLGMQQLKRSLSRDLLNQNENYELLILLNKKNESPNKVWDYVNEYKKYKKKPRVSF